MPTKYNRHSVAPISGIYLLRNLETQETYVGQSKDLNYRYKEHIYHNQSKVDKDIRNYGKECFDFIVLELCDHDELDEKEEYYIDALESDKYGYNQCKGGQHNIGESNSNVELSEQDVYDIREAYKNNINPNDVYLKYKDKVKISHFYNIWEGRCWNNVHMDVYENKDNRSAHASPGCYTNLSEEKVLELRTKYITMTATQIYDELDFDCSFNNLRSILSGATYKNIPVYDKKLKTWVNKS